MLYHDVILGDRVEVHAGTVLGGDGFGYRLIDGRHVKIPQTGRVEVGDDVEIGANCTIDRATFEATRIGEGTKIDNLVMIGHNNQIGRHNLLCGQVGIAGSCKTGDYVVMAGQAGIKDKTEIGDRVMVGAQAGVHRNVPGGQQVLGSPAIPVREQRRIFQMIARLPEMHRQLRELAAQIALLTAALPSGSRSRRPTRRDSEASSAAVLSMAKLTRSERISFRCQRSRSNKPDILARRSPHAAGSTDRPAGRERPVPDPVRRGGAAAGPAGRLRRDPLRGARGARATSATSFEIVGVSKLGGMIRAFQRQGRPADRHGGQGHQERDVHALADRPALARPPDDPHVVPDPAEATSATTRSCSR